MRGLSAADVANLTSLFGGRGTLTLDATTLKGASDINGSPGDANIDGWQIVQWDQRRGMAAQQEFHGPERVYQRGRRQIDRAPSDRRARAPHSMPMPEPCLL